MQPATCIWFQFPVLLCLTAGFFWPVYSKNISASKEKCDELKSVKFPTVKKYVLFFLCCFVTGDLEALKKQAFVLKEGVEYKIKISFKVFSKKQPLNIKIVWWFALSWLLHILHLILHLACESRCNAQLLRPNPVCVSTGEPRDRFRPQVCTANIQERIEEWVFLIFTIFLLTGSTNGCSGVMLHGNSDTYWPNGVKAVKQSGPVDNRPEIWQFKGR